MTNRAVGWTVDQFDVRVAERLCGLAGVDDPAMVTLAAVAASAPRRGHVCIDVATADALEVVCEHPPWTGAGARPEPRPLRPIDDVRRLLDRVVRSDLARRGDDAVRSTPLVVDDTRVYLDRYWSYEDRLYQQLIERSSAVGAPDDPAAVREVLDLAAPHDRDGPAVDRQRLAVANALLRPLSVISGGPGTGKTHTVVSLLIAHALLADIRGLPPPRIAVAAPTGKAAARMEEAIRTAVEQRDLPEDVASLVAGLRGRTLHRLLGWQRRSPTRFRHDDDNPLPHDVVVVDEASMVPLSLVTKLVEAVRPAATLVLVGDRDQLTSVEAGAVLGDICGPRPAGSSLQLSDGWSTVLADVADAPVDDERAPMPGPGLWDGIVQLERFRRFGPDTGIGAVARAIQRVADDAAPVIASLTAEATGSGTRVDAVRDVRLLEPDPGPMLPAALRPVVTAALGPYLEAVGAGDAATALDRIDALRVLCAVREGPLGVAAIGSLVERWIAEADDRLDPADEWYEGRPVLVTRNDHDLGVMNGDVGVTLHRDGRAVVGFRLADGRVREVPAIRVADAETVWAMTIHKSQGSQYDHAVVVLPDHDVEVVTRELLYTGLTRARSQVTVVARPDRFAAAVVRPVRRATGLRERLWPDPS